MARTGELRNGESRMVSCVKLLSDGSTRQRGKRGRPGRKTKKARSKKRRAFERENFLHSEFPASQTDSGNRESEKGNRQAAIGDRGDIAAIGVGGVKECPRSDIISGAGL
jgi:hypothetical protein